MAKTKHSSPTLQLKITPENYGRALQSSSGGCLIADAIKTQYPQYTNPSVTMAMISFTDRKAGVRYHYMTSQPAQHVLLAFDQGWPNPIDELVINRAVKIVPSRSTSKAKLAEQEARFAELEAKIASGEELTPGEKRVHTMLAKRIARPSSHGPVDVKVTSKGAVVHGGRPPKTNKANPNLLAGRNRHFGVKLADPGKAFNDAVEEALKERLAELEEGKHLVS